MKKAFIYGIASSLFFAVTFVLNRSMHLSGGDYLWSASLRYFFMLPFLMLLVALRRGLGPVHRSIRNAPLPWLLWSTVGFGLFYLPLSLASNYGASFLVAGTWEITILAGALMTPLWGKKVPIPTLLCSCIILLGVALLQVEQAVSVSLKDCLLCIIPLLIAAFAYPLGNRNMMILCGDTLNTAQRAYGMTLCSMPFWLLVGGVALWRSGPPNGDQAVQALIVAICSGVIATLLFFKATDLVKDHAPQLAAIEATQAGEVVFTLLGGLLFLNEPMPSLLSCVGLILIFVGIVVSSIVSARTPSVALTRSHPFAVSLPTFNKTPSDVE